MVGGKSGAGSVTVVNAVGSPRLITQNTSGVPGTPRPATTSAPAWPAEAGRSIQLAIGAPGEDVGSVTDAGSVTVLKRTDKTIYPATLLTQATKGVSGTVETGDQFGAAVAYRDDRTLAIGIPGEDLGTVVDAGSVQIVRVANRRCPSRRPISPKTPPAPRAWSRPTAGSAPPSPPYQAWSAKRSSRSPHPSKTAARST